MNRRLAHSLSLAALAVAALAPATAVAKEDAVHEKNALRVDLGSTAIRDDVVKVFFDRSVTDGLALQGIGMLTTPYSDGSTTYGVGYGIGGSLIWFPLGGARTMAGLSTELGFGIRTLNGASDSADTSVTISATNVSVHANVLYSWVGSNNLSLGVGVGVTENSFTTKAESDGFALPLGGTSTVPTALLRLGTVF